MTTPMISLINSFQINTDGLFNLMSRHNCFIAGGAATHAFLNSSVEDFTGDIDIWYQGAPQREGNTTLDAVISFRAAMKEFTEFFESQGYFWGNHIDMKRIGISREQLLKYQQDVHREIATYHDKSTKLSSVIRKILYFTKGQHKVQVIFSFYVKQRILESFDYSFCAVAYDHRTDSFDGIHLDLTKEKKGIQMNEPNSVDRGQTRFEKYQARGFSIVNA